MSRGPERTCQRILKKLIASRPGWWSSTRLWNTAKSRIMLEQQIAGMQGLGFEGWTVGRDEPPMCNLAAEQSDETKGWEISTNRRVVQIRGLGEDEPHAVVFRLLRAIAQHEQDLVTGV